MIPGLSDYLLDKYDYATDPALLAHLHSWDRVYMGAMMSYASGIGGFGRQLMAHQNRTALDGARFLRYLGFSDQAARNFRAAMLFHDLGKTHPTYNPIIWMLYERPTPAEKEQQRRHAQLGAGMFQTLTERYPALARHPHTLVRHAVTAYHHERTDGTGPAHIHADALPVFVQVSCIVDAFDGDMIPRPHQERGRTAKEALRRLAALDDDKKYAGAFSGRLLNKYIAMKEEQLGIVLSGPRDYSSGFLGFFKGRRGRDGE